MLNYNRIILVLLIIATLCIEYIIIGAPMLHPNDYNIVLGGDGMQIYFDMVYHVKHDTNTILQAMNYPFYESIFMTAAQGSVSTVLQFINKYIYNISDYTVGISNAFMIYLVPLASIYSYYLCRKLKINTALAFIAALYFTFLSPMFFRLIGGHFSMSYIFVIPYTIYTFLTLVEKMSFRSLLIFCMVALFFSLNDMYNSLYTMGIMITASFCFILFKEKRKNAWIIGIVTAVAFLFCIIILNQTDFKTHRVKVPYGFWNYYNLDKIFLPQHGKYSEWIHHLFSLKHNLDAYAYAGILALPFALWYVVYTIYIAIKKHKINLPFAHKPMNILLLVAILFYLFSISLPFYHFKDFTEKHLYKILQFRDPARYSMILTYFVLLYATIQLNKVFEKIKNNKLLLILFFIILIGLWSYDLTTTFNLQNLRINYTANIFKKNNTTNFTDNLKGKIEFKKYQAIYVLPIVQLWTDKFTHEDELVVWNYAMVTAYQNKIPIINAKLSRMDLYDAHACIQVVSNPLIQKELFKQLPSKKPLLLLYNLKEKITEGESYIKDKSKLLYISKDSIGYYELDPYQSFNDSLNMAYNNIKNTVTSSNYEYINFETDSIQPSIDGNRAYHFLPQGERFTKKDQINFLKLPMKKFKIGDRVEISFWQLSHNNKFGNIDITIKPFNGWAEFESYGTWQATAKDVYNHWIRGSYIMTVKDTNVVMNFFAAATEGYIDGVMMRKINENVFFPINKDSSIYNYNNYFIHLNK